MCEESYEYIGEDTHIQDRPSNGLHGHVHCMKCEKPYKKLVTGEFVPPKGKCEG